MRKGNADFHLFEKSDRVEVAMQVRETVAIQDEVHLDNVVGLLLSPECEQGRKDTVVKLGPFLGVVA
jgi:hypothetical protein